ncbi:MAG: hypothetical protein KBT34_08595 [Prevotella sp.]|nr:hypothetical protein [Candidatus Prevotella equi]
MKYKIPENEPQMASEPVMAVPIEMVQHKVSGRDFNTEITEMQTDDEFSVPSLQMTIDELKDAILKSEADYIAGRCHTAEEINSIVDSWCVQ